MEAVMKIKATQPVFVPPHTGRKLDFLAVTHKLTSQQTGAAYYMFESVFEPGTGNSLHVHRREDEVGYFLKGALDIRVGDQVVVVEAGGAAHLPKNIPHSIHNPGKTLARYLFITVPAGLDRWFDALDAVRQVRSTMHFTANSLWFTGLNSWSNC